MTCQLKRNSKLIIKQIFKIFFLKGALQYISINNVWGTSALNVYLIFLILLTGENGERPWEEIPPWGYVSFICVRPWHTRVQLPEKVPVSLKTGYFDPGTGSTIRVSKFIRCVWDPVSPELELFTPWGSWQAEQGAPAARWPLWPPFPIKFFLKLSSLRMLVLLWQR